MTWIERSDNKPRSLDADTKLLQAVMSRSDSAPLNSVQDTLEQRHALVFPLRMAKPLMTELSKIFGQNVHVLKQDFMRSVQWYSINGPYDDILAAGFRRLVDAGIERFWADKDDAIYGVAVLSKYLGDGQQTPRGDYRPVNLSLLVKPRMTVGDEGEFVAATISYSLISESFTAYGIGISIALGSFLVAAAWLMVHYFIEWQIVTVE